MATYTSNYAWAKPAGSDPVDISVLNDNLDSQDSIIHNAFLNMAEPFSESSTYAVGDIVLYGIKTYRCRVAVTTAGSWTGATNWDEYKLAELVLDNAPTDGSNNPVKSDGIYDSEKDIYAVMGQMGAKNLIPFPYYNPSGIENRGVTFTYNADGIIYMTGMSEQSAQPYFLLQNQLVQNPAKILEGHSYILYCGSDSPYALGQIFFRHNGSTLINLNFTYEYSDGVTGEATQNYISCRRNDGTICPWVKFNVISGSAATPQIDLRVDAGKHQVNNAYAKVMLIDGRDTDLTWQIYAKTNKRLTDDVSSIIEEQTSIKTELVTKADKTATASGETLALVPTSEGRALLHTAYGMSTQDGTPTPSVPVDIVSAKADFRSVGKNLFKYPYFATTHEENGITFTDNGDGTISLRGTASAVTVFVCLNNNNHQSDDTLFALKKGRYILSGGYSNNIKVRLYHNTSPFDIIAESAGSDTSFVVNEDITDATMRIRVAKDTAISGSVTVYPMLRLADVTDSTYEPYQKHDTTTDLTLRAIEVTSSDAYNLVRDGKYYVADTLDYDEDNGFVVTRRIEERIIDGNYTLTSSSVSSSGNTMCLPTASAPANKYLSKLGGINNRFTLGGSSVGYSNLSSAEQALSNGEFGYRNNLYSWGSSNYFKNTSMTSAEDWNTWFANNPIKEYLVLATPTTETITTAQALTLLGLKTYDESTTISSQAEPSCTIAVEYAKERLGALALTAYNTAKGNDLRITALES